MDLNTVERFILIAHHPDKGRFKITPIHFKYGIAGAILVELSLRKNIEIQNGRIRVNDKSDPQDIDYPIFEQITQTIAKSGRTRKPKYWLQKFSFRSRKLKWEFLKGLEKKKLVRIEKLSFLWIPYRKCYLVDARTRQSLIQNLKESILYRKKKNEEDIAIMGIIEACSMDRMLATDRSQRKLIRNELKKVLKESPFFQIFKDIISQIRIALIAVASASS